MSSDLWRAVRESARERLMAKNYSESGVAPISARRLASLDPLESGLRGVWIPGVEIIRRPVYAQRFRGWFSEFGRCEEGACGKLGFWPRQWSVARMYTGTFKGFHIHPPHVPEGQSPEDWFRRLFVDAPDDYSARPYSSEQWDLLFVVAGTLQMILVDERLGLERRVMRFFVDSGEASGESVGVLVPPGVAHGMQVEGSEDVIMVYGTSISFDPLCEGRIASEIEVPDLPREWKAYLES